jgi:hypothetical protein
MHFAAGAGVRSGRGSKVKTTKDGIPVILGDLIPKFRSRDLEAYQEALTALQYDHFSTYWPNPDLAPIVNKTTFDADTDEAK